MKSARAWRPALLVGAAWALAPATGVAAAKAAHVAVPDFKIDGEGTPALALQLQDGFVLGLVRAGIQVLDPVDVGRKLESTPELAACDSSACLKSLGKVLNVNYVVRVKVDVAGNSYKMVARLFSTEGATPAVLPVSTKSRTCDVCTVAEARDYMMKLADALRPELQDTTPQPILPPAPPPAAPASLVPPLVAAMAGAMAMGIGFALFASMPDCHATSVPTSCDDNRARSALAGGLVGAGAVTTLVGAWVTVARSTIPGSPTSSSTTTISLALRF